MFIYINKRYYNFYLFWIFSKKNYMLVACVFFQEVKQLKVVHLESLMSQTLNRDVHMDSTSTRKG